MTSLQLEKFKVVAIKRLKNSSTINLLKVV